jgi:hypothetical protein
VRVAPTLERLRGSRLQIHEERGAIFRMTAISGRINDY